MEPRNVAVDELVLPEWNPRKIREHDFQRLVPSINDDPEPLKARPIIISTRSDANVMIAGNMDVRAAAGEQQGEPRQVGVDRSAFGRPA
jgi:hypothetical protein